MPYEDDDRMEEITGDDKADYEAWLDVVAAREDGEWWELQERQARAEIWEGALGERMNDQSYREWLDQIEAAADRYLKSA